MSETQIYPESIFESKKEGSNWLRGANIHHLKKFVRTSLLYGTAFPFGGSYTEGLPGRNFHRLILSLEDEMIEIKMKQVLFNLVSEYFNEVKMVEFGHIDEEDFYRYLYNLIDVVTNLQVEDSLSDAMPTNNKQQDTIPQILFQHAYNGTFIGIRVYGEDMHYFILKCLFSYPISNETKYNWENLCSDNIEIADYAPLCYRLSYEISHDNAILLLDNYINAIKDKSEFFRLYSLKRFTKQYWASKALNDNIDYFIEHVLLEYMRLGKEEDLKKIGISYDINHMKIAGPAGIETIHFFISINAEIGSSKKTYTQREIRRLVKKRPFLVEKLAHVMEVNRRSMNCENLFWKDSMNIISDLAEEERENTISTGG